MVRSLTFLSKPELFGFHSDLMHSWTSPGILRHSETEFRHDLHSLNRDGTSEKITIHRRLDSLPNWVHQSQRSAVSHAFLMPRSMRGAKNTMLSWSTCACWKRKTCSWRNGGQSESGQGDAAIRAGKKKVLFCAAGQSQFVSLSLRGGRWRWICKENAG